MKAFKLEKWFSTALYRNPLKIIEIIKKNIPKISNITPIAREIPLMIETKNIDSKIFISGYVTGWRVVKSDILAYGNIEDQNVLIPIEMKQKAGNNALAQVMTYVYSIMTTFFESQHSDRGRIYNYYFKKLLEVKNLNSINNLENLIIQPIVISIKEKRINENDVDGNQFVQLSKGLTNLIRSNNIIVERIKIIELKADVVESIFNEFIKLRANDLSRIYPKSSSIFQKLADEQKILKYTNSDGIAYIEMSGKEDVFKCDFLENETSKAIRKGNAGPSIVKLIENKRGKFYIQSFLNGLNNPVFYFEIKPDCFAAFEHRFPYQFHFNGSYNEYIARDAIPLHENPEAGEIYCIEHGTYQSQKMDEANLIKIIMNSENGMKFETILISPLIQNARYDNMVRPFMTINQVHEQIKKAGTNLNQIYDYSSYDFPFIINSIRIFNL